MKDFWPKVMVSVTSAAIIAAGAAALKLKGDVDAIKVDLATIKARLSITTAEAPTNQKQL